MKRRTTTSWERRTSVLILFLGTMTGELFSNRPGTAWGEENPPAPSATGPSESATTTALPQELLDRLQKLEGRLDQVTKQNEELSRKNKRLTDQVESLTRAIEKSGPREGTASKEPGETTPAAIVRDDDSSSGISARASGGSHRTSGGGSKASGGDPTATSLAQEVGNRHRGKLAVKSKYDFDHDGLIFSTDDDEFSIGLRAMSQVEARIYQQPNQDPVSNGFYNPRTRVYFEGHFTRPIQYEFSFQNTFDSVNLLDAYLDFKYDPRLQLRIGRFKTPFTYEWYRIHVWHLLAPERSLFANNFEGNRRFGLMGSGSLFDQRLEYAVGTFDTQRNSYQPFSNRQDVMAFLNAKPFYNRERGFPLRNLQVGGSVDAGTVDQPLVPSVLRTNSAPSAAGVDTSGAANAATLPFLAFNENVRERGARSLWELHSAYYYGGLSLLGAWQGGFAGYAKGPNGTSTRVPIHGWFAQVGYLVTGETLRDRTLVDPLHPFDLRPGRFGLGAFELTARYSTLELGQEVFTAGLADPNLWTNRTEMTDVGFNWYLNKFIKVYFDWEHAMFAQPVRYRPGPGPNLQKTSDLFWLRTQVYF